VSAGDSVRIDPPQQNVPFLTITHAPDVWHDVGPKGQLREQVLSKYHEARRGPGATKVSCVVQIETKIGGTPIGNALFDLFDEVSEAGGSLICVGFPEDTLDALTATGLTSLPGLILADNRDQALALLPGLR
jgi:hypothetical protein